jgi:hypothetical protein
MISLLQGNYRIRMGDDNTGETWNTNVGTATDGSWHHVAMTWQASDGRGYFYVDGLLAASTTWRAGQPLLSGGSIVLGQDQDNVGGGFQANQAFAGDLDEMRVWNRVRSVAEIASAMGSLIEPTRQTGLAYYWRLDDEANLLRDDSGNGQDLTLAGAATWHSGLFGLLQITVTDNDIAKILVSSSIASLTEGDSVGTSYTVVLSSKPTALVSVSMVSTPQTRATPASLSFTDLDWAYPQTVVLTAVDDLLSENPYGGTHPGGVVKHTTSSSDSNYDGFYNDQEEVLFELSGDLVQCLTGTIFVGNGHCYKGYSSFSDLAAATATCTAFGGYLASVTSEAENAFVKSMTLSTFPLWWIGVSDELEEGTWVNDDPDAGLATFTKWANLVSKCARAPARPADASMPTPAMAIGTGAAVAASLLLNTPTPHVLTLLLCCTLPPPPPPPALPRRCPACAARPSHAPLTAHGMHRRSAPNGSEPFRSRTAVHSETRPRCSRWRGSGSRSPRVRRCPSCASATAAASW